MTSRRAVESRWFPVFQFYAILTLCIQLLFEFPKLSYMLQAANTGVYTIFPPIPNQPASGSHWWWLIVHVLSSVLMSEITCVDLIMKNVKLRRRSKHSVAFSALVAFTSLWIVGNSNHFGGFPPEIGILVQCSMISIICICLFYLNLSNDIILVVFYLIFTIPSWLTLHAYFSSGLIWSTLSFKWTFIGYCWLFLCHRATSWFIIKNPIKMVR
jgi:hypothetical protein